MIRRFSVLFVFLVFCVSAFSQEKQDLYVVERDIPYHAEAGEYAAERCKLGIPGSGIQRW